MPELPDLQVFSYNLNKKFKGKTLKHINVPVDKKLNVPLRKLQESIEGQKLVEIKRVGKELHFDFSHQQVLGMHLMLHGQLFFFEGDNTSKYTIAELVFDGGTGLALTDFQKAAVLTLNPEPNDVPDALEIDFDYLKAKLSKLRKPIKTVLLDQHILRGIGNAYADEILWHARISPLSIANILPDEQVKTLVKSIKNVLDDAEKQILKARPDTISGEYREFLIVHQPRQKQTTTGAVIHQKEIGSRKSYYTDEQELFS